MFKNQRFALGRLLITPGAKEILGDSEVFSALGRHASGDWGDVSEDDANENEFSVSRKLRIFSVYHSSNGEKFWVITEADRSATTVLLPEEY